MDDGANAFKGPSNQIFPDVYAGFWAEGYISWAAGEGLVAVPSAGSATFRPDDPITAAEFIKILLVMLGYDPVAEGFVTDAGWWSNVMNVARAIGLTDGFTGDSNDPITRDDAALILVNMLFCNTAGYDANGNFIRDLPTFAAEHLNLYRVSGPLLATSEAGLGRDPLSEGTSLIEVTSLPNAEPFELELPLSASMDLIGLHVTAYVRMNAGHDPSDLDDPDRALKTVCGVISATPDMNTVVLATPEDFADEPGYDTDDLTAAGGYYVNFAGLSGEEDPEAAVAALARGNEVRLVSNDGDDKFDLVLATNYAFSGISSIDKKTAGDEIAFSNNALGIIPTSRVAGFGSDPALGQYVLAFQPGNPGFKYDKTLPALLHTIHLESDLGKVGEVGTENAEAKIGSATYTYATLSGVPTHINAAATFVATMGEYVGVEMTFYAHNGYLLWIAAPADTSGGPDDGEPDDDYDDYDDYDPYDPYDPYYPSYPSYP